MTILKKISVIIMTVCISLSLGGCKIIDYGKGVKAYKNGQYKEANQILSALPGYRDSDNILKESKWKGMCEYLSDKKEADGDKSWKFEMVSEDNKIIYEASMDFNQSMVKGKYKFKIIFSQNSEKADIFGEMYFGLGSAWSDNKAEGTWDIKNYTSGNEVKFSKTEAEGKQVNGSDVTDSSLTAINPEQVKQFIFGGIQKIMKEYDENFTLKDIGFESVEE